MAINFPTSLDNFTNPSSGNTLDSPSHSLQHSDLNDAVEALEAKVGIGASPAGSATSGQVLTISAAGTSTWSTPTPVGLFFIRNSNFSGASTHSFGSDASPIFTSSYGNYKIILSNLNGETAVRAFGFRLRANTTDLSSGSYHYQQLTVAQTTVSAVNAINQTSWPIGIASNGSGEISSIVIELQNPQAALSTTYLANNAYWQSGVGPSTRQNNGSVLNSNQYNGFTILSDGNISGTMSVYGYNK